MKTVDLGEIFQDKIEIDVLQMKSLTWQLYWFWDLIGYTQMTEHRSLWFCCCCRERTDRKRDESAD